MALFGILRGKSTDLSSQPFHDGWCYYETDSGKFWIDALDENNNETRRCINSGGGGSVAIEKVLDKDLWVGNTYHLEVEGLTADSNGVAGISQGANSHVYEIAISAALRITQQINGGLTLVATGETPDANIPITIVLFTS